MEALAEALQRKRKHAPARLGRTEQKTVSALAGAPDSSLPVSPTNPPQRAESHPARAVEILTVIQATWVPGQPGEHRK